MIKTPKIKGTALLFLAIFLLQYVFEHSIYLLTDAVYAGTLTMSATTLSVIRVVASYVLDAVEIISFGLASVYTLVALSVGGLKRALAIFGVIAATKLAYVFPHYYIAVMSEGSYNTLDALILLFPIALGVLLFFLVEAAAALGLGVLPAAIAERRGGAPFKERIATDLAKGELIDVMNLGTAAIAIIAGVGAIKPLVMTLIATVEFFAGQGSAYSGGDVFQIVFDFIFIILLAVITYFLMHIAKNKLTDVGEGEADKEKNEEDAL